MCELFGVTADKKINVNAYLQSFFRHSKVQPDGWGLALFDDNNISIEKEPVKASTSKYLEHRLQGKIQTAKMMAHIRRATMGEVNFNNTHPFSAIDESGRRWVLVHNGTIFEAPGLSKYQYSQQGSTDSERILLYIIDRVNSRFMQDPCGFDVNERLALIDEIILQVVPGNKLNLLLYDGDYFYVHKNEKGTLYTLEKPGITFFATRPLDEWEWKELPMNRLLVYKNGKKVYSGTEHEYEYVYDEEQMKHLFLDYAGL
ncbi:MAG: class II glutamine amidotransferase [Lachnospiraceae bacterium]|nr:class II glutamine amidotransferase [Lachnospiraceae bacterium]